MLFAGGLPVRSKRGFTLVELLVVIAVIGVLIALLLPAIQAAREAARRTQCVNNLKQMGIAMHTHHDALGYMPVSQTGSGAKSGGACGVGYFSWRARLLPFLEQRPLYESIDFAVNMSDSCDSGAPISASHRNAVAAATLVSVFRCPSDGANGDNATVMGSANPASDNYSANAGWPSRATGLQGERPTPGDYNGVISLENPGAPVAWHSRSRTSLKDITDGTSNTAAVAERLVQTGSTLEEIRNALAVLRSYHVTGASRTLPVMAERCNSANTHADPVASTYLGRAWISGWSAAAPTYMHLKTPNIHSCHFDYEDAAGDVAITPSSHHSGGVNVLMADGRVDFVADGIEPTAWWTMGSRNDGGAN